MPRYGISMMLEDGWQESEAGRAKCNLQLRQVKSAIRTTLGPVRYAALTPADYTWNAQHHPDLKLWSVHVSVMGPEIPQPAKL